MGTLRARREKAGQEGQPFFSHPAALNVLKKCIGIDEHYEDEHLEMEDSIMYFPFSLFIDQNVLASPPLFQNALLEFKHVFKVFLRLWKRFTRFVHC